MNKVAKDIAYLNSFPNAHKEIHKNACKNCPSANFEPDPESLYYKQNYTKDEIIKHVLFPCGWRPSKLCKGLCGYHNITEKDLT